MAFIYKRPVDTCGEGNGSVKLYGDGVHWQSFPVLYSLDVTGETLSKNTPEEVRDVMRNCFEYVNDIMGFEFFRYTPDETKAKVKCMFGPLDGTTLGRCSSNYSKSTKKMNRSTILMDSSNRSWFINPKQSCSGGGSYFDFANTFTHEIGHCIRLAHNLGDKMATMYNKAPRGSTYRRTFSKGEIESLKKTYAKWVNTSPSPSPPAPEPTPPSPSPVIEKPTEGIILHGGWGANQDPNTWTIVNMRDRPHLFKVVDDKGINVATDFSTREIAQQYIDYHKQQKIS